MRESQLFLYSRVVREAHGHIKAEEGLKYARAFMEPKQLVEDLYGKPEPKPKSLMDRVKEQAERVRRMIDSGSHGSNRRLKRRKGASQ